MAARYTRWPRVGALVAGLLLVAGGSGRADEKGKEDPLRAELLKLNGAGTEKVQDARLRALLKDREKAKKLVAEAVKMVKEAKDGEKPFNLNGTAILARTAHELKQYDVAEKFYERQIEFATELKSGPKMLAAYDNLIDMYFDAKRYQDAIDKSEDFMDLRGPKEVEEAKPFVIEKIIQATARMGKTDEALGMVKNLLQATDNNWYFLRLRGIVEREGGKTDAAITTFTEVLDKLDAAKEIKGDAKDRIKDGVRYTLSGLYVENKDIDKAAKQLQTLIKRNPDNPSYKNDLGFIWCDHDMNLEESEKLIREALELDKKRQEKLKADGEIDEIKESAAYLDSLGWVLFKQKKYKEALEPLKKAAKDEEEGGHLEIWDHLADCHMALGQKKEAVAAWEKGLKMEDLSKRDGERRRKISEKLKKAKAETTKD
jgi:tetratricopeptide (TPR) repeat protein